MKELVIRRTVTITTTIPFTPESYGNSTLEDAIAYERDMSPEDQALAITEGLMWLDESLIDYGCTVTVQDTE